jgi:hypothetical protein
MSAITIAGDTSGSITLDAPAVAGTTTLTLPTRSGTVMVNGPTFSAGQTTLQSIANATFTKIQLQTEEFDTNNNYDATTNYRFTPTVAGYYQVNGSVNLASTAATVIASIWKNGVEFKRGAQSGAAANCGLGSIASALIYLNGSTDYVELYGYQASGVAVNTSGTSNTTYFQAALVRGA